MTVPILTAALRGVPITPTLYFMATMPTHPQSASSSPPAPGVLSAADVLHIAKLARLEVPSDHVDEYRERLSTVVGYVSSLTAIDVSGVAPLTAPPVEFSRLRSDIPRTDPNESAPVHASPSMLATSVLAAMAPATQGPFVRVPKVIE